jgi:PAS domain S-box-containing protein
MKNNSKTKQQLINELKLYREQNDELKKLHKENAELKKLIIKQKKEMKKISESEKMHKTIIRNFPDSFALFTLDGTCLEASQGALDNTGYKTAEELIGMKGFDIIAPEETEKAKSIQQELMQKGFKRNYEYSILRKDGTRRILESNAILLKDNFGEPKFVLITSRDITKRKIAEKKLQQEVNRLRKHIQQGERYPVIIGNSSKMLQIIDLVHQVARTNSTILISGETGSGKDLIAQAIHYSSPRKEAPFLAINCAALPEQLIESELFGYVKGAFTGASQDKTGLFEEAHKGTIFLDEIGDLPLSLQGKLLQVLEKQIVRRLGQSKSIIVDVRIIAATNKNLKEAVKRGTFREDLYYRLNVFPLKVPSLRERKEDIPLLAKYFLDKYCLVMKKEITTISQEAMDILTSYPFPGNVRELENIIQRSLIIAQGSILHKQNLPEELTDKKSINKYQNLPDSLAEIERKKIENTLKECHGHLTRTAKKLGISRTSLWRKINKFNINISDFVS